MIPNAELTACVWVGMTASPYQPAAGGLNEVLAAWSLVFTAGVTLAADPVTGTVSTVYATLPAAPLVAVIACKPAVRVVIALLVELQKTVALIRRRVARVPAATSVGTK